MTILKNYRLGVVFLDKQVKIVRYWSGHMCGQKDLKKIRFQKI